MKTLAVVIACGKEEQIGEGVDTAFVSLGNRPVLAHSLQTFQRCSCVDGIVVVVSKDRVDGAAQIVKRFGCTKFCGVVIGGATRLITLRTVFSKISEMAPLIILHEVSRPFVTCEVIELAVKSAKRYGCAIAANRIPDSVKIATKGGKAEKTLERNSVWVVQSPQVFKVGVLEAAVLAKDKGIKLIDDESSLVCPPTEVRLIEAGARNMKIRSSDDLALATAIFNAEM